MVTSESYNPDVLTCLANLSSDEVFTPPALANQLIDLLPADLWSNPDARFLDPFTKSGVFLREMAKRLDQGLAEVIPDRQARLDHIFGKQLHGIAITSLTALLARRSLYCSRSANGKRSVADGVFDTPDGNIRFNRIEHTWKDGKCRFCGASQIEYDRDNVLESHAYEFIHTDDPQELFDMKFDVIIGNPPYQLSDGGHSRSASPIYDQFVQQAMKLSPRYLTMIIPARWYAGGKGLDEFRRAMLGDRRLRTLVDFEKSPDVFPGVDVAGGICYFLWEKSYDGDCEVVNFFDGQPFSSIRRLDEFGTFIRHERAASIVRKVRRLHGESSRYLNDVVSVSKPFGLRTFYVPRDKGVPCWFIQKIGLKFADEADVTDTWNLRDKWKLLLPAAPIAGQTDFSRPVGFYYEGNTRIAKPGEICTESFIVGGAFDSEEEALSFRSYLFTKVARFLLLQAVISQHVTKRNFVFVPDLGTYKGVWTDDQLRQRWEISEEEWQFIDSRITSVGKESNSD